MIFGSSVRGISEVNRNIEAMKPRIKIATGKALDASGEMLLGDAKRRATSDHVRRSLIIATPSPNVRTLTVRPGEFTSRRVVRGRGKVGSNGRRRRGRRYQPDETVRFYRFLELGTKHHAAKPFMVPAIVSFRQSGLGHFADNFKL